MESSLEEICNSKLDSNLKDYILDSYDNGKLSLPDVCYLFLNFRGNQIMMNIVEEMSVKMYYNKVDARIVSKFILRWNQSSLLYIDPIKLFIDITDSKWMSEVILEAYKHDSVYRKDYMHKLLTTLLSISEGKLRDIINCIKDVSDENILELYIRGCPCTGDYRGISMAIFSEEIVKIIIELTNVDLKNTHLTYYNIMDYVKSLTTDNV